MREKVQNPLAEFGFDAQTTRIPFAMRVRLIAGKKALEKAAAAIAERLLPKLVKK